MFFFSLVGLLQKVLVWAAAGGVSLGPLPPWPLQCGDCHQDGGEQTGRCGLSHLDLPLPPYDAEPKLLQSARSVFPWQFEKIETNNSQTHKIKKLSFSVTFVRNVPSSPVGPPVWAGGKHATWPGAVQVHQHRGWDGCSTTQFGHDCCLLLHQLHHHRFVPKKIVTLKSVIIAWVRLP